MLPFLFANVIGNAYRMVGGAIMRHGYITIFLLMVLESASLPIVPSEILLPAAGYFARTGILSLPLAFATVLLAGFVGMGINYYIAYIIGKEIVYKHARLFHVTKQRLIAFEHWFAKKGAFAVFFSRLLPVIRGLINFPAGFARMPLKQFYFYSTLGALIWDALLIGFGYYALSFRNVYLLIAAVAAFFVLLYAAYWYATKKIK